MSSPSLSPALDALGFSISADFGPGEYDVSPLGVVCATLAHAYAEEYYAHLGFTWDLTDTRIALLAHDRMSESSCCDAPVILRKGFLAVGPTMRMPCWGATRAEALEWSAGLLLKQLGDLGTTVSRRWAAWGRDHLVALGITERVIAAEMYDSALKIDRPAWRECLKEFLYRAALVKQGEILFRALVVEGGTVRGNTTTRTEEDERGALAWADDVDRIEILGSLTVQVARALHHFRNCLVEHSAGATAAAAAAVNSITSLLRNDASRFLRGRSDDEMAHAVLAYVEMRDFDCYEQVVDENVLSLDVGRSADDVSHWVNLCLSERWLLMPAGHEKMCMGRPLVITDEGVQWLKARRDPPPMKEEP